MNNPINNELFDTRDLIEYKEHLESELLDSYNTWVEQHNDNCEEGSEISEATTLEEAEYLDEESFTQTCQDELDELESIKDFCEELSSSPDFEYGEAVIHEDYFTEYCKDLLEDCGYIPKDMPHWIVLDFEATAENMKVDYYSVDFDGEEYYIRH